MRKQLLALLEKTIALYIYFLWAVSWNSFKTGWTQQRKELKCFVCWMKGQQTMPTDH